MEHLYERISYLMGLAEGLAIGEESKEGKLLLHIIDTLEDFADAINEVYDDQADLADYVDYIDEDLSDVEEEVFGDVDDEYDYLDDYDFEDDIDYVEVVCPHCDETIYIEEDLLDEDASCPNCLEMLDGNFEDDEK